MSSVHLAGLLSVLLITYLNFPAALRAISFPVTSGVPFGLRSAGNGRLFCQQGHTTGRQDKWAESRDSFIIGNNADICVVAYNREVGPAKVRGGCSLGKHGRKRRAYSDVDHKTHSIGSSIPSSEEKRWSAAAAWK